MKLDKLGASLSLLCALHCISLPILLTTMPLLGQSFLTNPILEASLIVGSLVIAAYTLFRDYLYTHHRWTALVVAAVGFGFILSAHWVFPPAAETLFMLMGGIFTSSAYYINWRLRKSCAGACRQTTVSQQF